MTNPSQDLIDSYAFIEVDITTDPHLRIGHLEGAITGSLPYFTGLVTFVKEQGQDTKDVEKVIENLKTLIEKP